MKKVLLVAALFTAIITNAQTKYETGMAKGLSMLKEAKSPAQFTEAEAFFERIADAEKTQWLPYYYAAVAQANFSFMQPNAEKDKACDKTDELLTKAEALEKNNSEILCVKAMSSTSRMMVDPQARYMSWMSSYQPLVEQSKKADPTNPRPYYLQGQTVINTPEQFGGGKAAAKPILTKAVELFKTFKPASPLHPTWGQESAEKTLASCN